MPKYEISQEERAKHNLPQNCKSEDFLLALIKKGFDEKFKAGKVPKDKIEEYQQRIDEEFGEITRLLFTDYILLVYKVINFCKNNKILNGPARGSAGGSLILYIIDVVKIDPIKHNLLFERFISSARTDIKEINGEVYISSGSLPDVDIDSSGLQKHLINDFLVKEFPQRTAAISNISTFQSKAIIKEVYKCYEEGSEDEAREIADLIEVKFGKVDSIEDSLKSNEKFKKWAAHHKETVEIAAKLNGLAKNISVHASGIVICNDIIENMVPLRLSKDNNEFVSVYDMDSVQYFGIKLDNLGLKNLDIIDEVLKDTQIKIEDIDVNDKGIYELLNDTDCYYGIFQAAEGLGKNTMKRLKCENIEEISISIACGRPGSMRFIDDIIKYKENRSFRTIHPKIDSILKDTFGVICFQEQIMRLCGVMADFTKLETNNVRKHIGKKQRKDLLKYKEKFIQQSVNNGFNKELVEDVWLSFEQSGDYLFNRSHSTGYAYLTAICAYVKKYFPLKFFCASLNATRHEQNCIEEISKIQQELQFFNIRLLPPHILKSETNFTIENNDIRFGLSSVKGISEKSIEKLKDFRNVYSTKFEIFKAANEAKIPSNIAANLIVCGALDDMLTESRAKTVLELILWNILTEKEKLKCLELGAQYNFNLINLVKELNTIHKNKSGKDFFIKSSRMETIRKRFNPYSDLYKFNNKNAELCVFFGEQRLLGYSYTTNLYKIFSKIVNDLLNIQSVVQSEENDQVHFVGEVLEVRQGKSREKKTPYMKMIVKDHCAQITTLTFNTERNDKISECEENNGRLPKEGDIVCIRGHKKGDAVFTINIGIQDCSVLDKISQLKDVKDVDNP